MATTQKPRPAAQRMSSGKDIFSRMLQLEKQGKQHRAASASPTLPVSPRSATSTGPVPRESPSPTRMPKSPLPTPRSPLRPPPTPRSKTSPSLSSDAHNHKQGSSSNALKINTLNNGELPAGEEICLSPSWSDHGEKQRKKDQRRMEKEQKILEKRLREDEERKRNADIRAGKRLSRKPPPAAMETQKMPSLLRRSSWISLISTQPSSGENSRRSSREEKRLSGISFGSLKPKRRSQSTPASDPGTPQSEAETSQPWHSIVSSAAPKLPTFGWRSRKNSSNTLKSITLDSDDAYERDLITFAYRLETSTNGCGPGELLNTEYKVQPPDSKHLASRQDMASPNVSESNLASVLHNPASSEGEKRQPVGDWKRAKANTSVRLDDPFTQYVDHNMKAAHQNGSARGGVRNGAHDSKLNHDLSSPRYRPQLQKTSSHDGSSYVHKQRMHQQQLSIAGFEDQLAIKKANEKALKMEAMQEEISRSLAEDDAASECPNVSSKGAARPTGASRHRKENTGLLNQNDIKHNHANGPPSMISARSEQTAGSKVQNIAQIDGNSDLQVHKSIHGSLQSDRDSVSLGKTQVAPGSKTDKVLGFRRRMKPPPSKISVNEKLPTNTVTLQSTPPSVTNLEELAGKRSKIERMFKEPKPVNANSDDKKRSGSLASGQAKETTQEAKSIQSHNRNRTSSSTVLNENLPSPTPGSLNKPDESTQSGPTKQTSQGKDHQVSRRKKQMSGTEAETIRSRSIDTVDGKISKSKVNENPLVASQATNDGVNVKHHHISNHEMIIQSTTEDGLVRKTSVTRSRSNPQLQTQTTATNSLPPLDFLPPLKHQPLVKTKPHSPPRPAPVDSALPAVPQMAAQISPRSLNISLTSHPPDLKLIPRSPLRPPPHLPPPPISGPIFNRSSTDVATNTLGKGAGAEGLDAKPIAKLFVICCKCKFWHDLPSKLYEAMALPKELYKDEQAAGGNGQGKVTGARLETAVKCPWCEHAMTTWCCQGWTTVVYLHERHH